ncbi:MAG: aminotransferase class I/II-fold pyridoxal phosphate-dependent enzyme [Pseudomonadota bacterium]
MSQNNIFSKFDDVSQRIERIDSMGETRPFGVVFDRLLSQTRALVGNREVILAGTNNYLGLTYEDTCMSAAKSAVDEHGTATTGSRLANGTYAEHVALEDELKEHFNASSAMVFTTGYQSNLAAIGALAGKGDHLIIDTDSHACIYDGCRLSDAETHVFRHNSPENLDRRLKRLPETGARLVVVEGLYSMFGDVAPVAELTEVAHNNNAMILVDEAHSVGCYGDRGHGVSAAQGVLDQVDFITGTFSKSFASIGGFCVSRHPQFEMIRLTSRPYLFTASGSPANVAVARAALKIIANDGKPRAALWARARQLHAGLRQLGFEPLSDPGPIVAIEIADELTAVQGWNTLLDQGVYVNLALPPATPQSKSLLRLSVSAAHSEEDIDQIIEAFKMVSTGKALRTAS